VPVEIDRPGARAGALGLGVGRRAPIKPRSVWPRTARSLPITSARAPAPSGPEGLMKQS
jgi:hypothetical protein